jgi:hypothetical protein
MTELTPSLFCPIELDGLTLDVMSWYERKYVQSHTFDKVIRFAFKTTWKAHGGYNQHAIVYVNPQTMSAAINQVGGPKAYIKKLLADRYEWRKSLGHGIIPYGASEEEKGKRAETYEATGLNPWLRKPGHTSQCTDLNN